MKKDDRIEIQGKKRSMNIELRSEEVQELMERVPPYIQRVGMTILLLIVISFFIASTFLKYPTYIRAKARVLSNGGIEVVLCPKDAIFLMEVALLERHVSPGDTLCILLTNGTDTLPVLSNYNGKAYSIDFYEHGMHVDANTQLFIIEEIDSRKDLGTSICLYLPHDTVARYKIGNKLYLRINNDIYDFHISAITPIPNSDGECAIKCHSSMILPWHILSAKNQDVELLLEDKTIFETFFKERLFSFKGIP